MKDFWDRKAQENATWYISSYRDYDDQDPEAFWQWGRKLAKQFLDESELPFTGDESMLEIGCGIGRMTAYFAERFAHVHALDVSAEMIRQAKEVITAPNVNLYTGNGEDLSDLGDAAVDLVFSYIVFQHIPDAHITQNYIREAGRVLKPGGHFYFQVNNLPPRGMRERLGLGRRLRAALGKSGSTKESGPRELHSPAWVGSRISLPAVDEALTQGSMQRMRIANPGLQYCWVLAQKNPA